MPRGRRSSSRRRARRRRCRPEPGLRPRSPALADAPRGDRGRAIAPRVDGLSRGASGRGPVRSGRARAMRRARLARDRGAPGRAGCSRRGVPGRRADVQVLRPHAALGPGRAGGPRRRGERSASDPCVCRLSRPARRSSRGAARTRSTSATSIAGAKRSPTACRGRSRTASAPSCRPRASRCFPGRDARAQYQVRDRRDRFDGPLGGDVVLDARWRIVGPDRNDVVERRFATREPVGAATYAAQVAAMSKALEGAEPRDRRRSEGALSPEEPSALALPLGCGPRGHSRATGSASTWALINSFVRRLSPPFNSVALNALRSTVGSVLIVGVDRRRGWAGEG